MKLYVLMCWCLFSLAQMTALQASPTVAGTTISNQASLTYSINGIVQTAIPSDIASFVVLELINVNLVWQDVAPVHINTPQINAALTFALTNTGNGVESYSLQRNNSIVGDQFDPLNAGGGAIYLENGLQAGFQVAGPFADTLYINGTNDPVLQPESTLVIYVSSDIPSALSIGDTALVALQVQSRTIGVAGSAPGSVHPNISMIGAVATENVVTGLTRGQASATGRYVVDGAVVRVYKTIVSPTDSKMLIPGVQLRYRLQVEVQGIGTVQNLIITDPMPLQLDYVANSIMVDGSVKTDAVDSDHSQFINNTVSINLGNVTAPAAYTIEFRATLK